MNSSKQAVVRLFASRTFLVKLLPVCLYLDLAKRIFKRQFNYFFFILLYQMKNNKTIINEFEKALILFAEISKREVFSKGPRSKQSYDRLLLEIKTPQAIVCTKGTSIHVLCRNPEVSCNHFSTWQVFTVHAPCVHTPFRRWFCHFPHR